MRHRLAACLLAALLAAGAAACANPQQIPDRDSATEGAS